MTCISCCEKTFFAKCGCSHVLHHSIWRHVILIAAVLSSIASIGLSYGASSSISAAAADRFHLSLKTSQWIGKTNIATMQLLTPVGAILARLTSLKNVQLLGATLAAVGVGGASAAPHFWVSILLFGVIGGLGLSLVLVAGVGIVREHYEDKHVHFGLSIFLGGLYFGVVAFPPLAEYTFQTFKYKGGMLMLAPWMLLHIITGLTYFKKSELPHNSSITSLMHDVEMKADTIYPSLSKAFKNFPVLYFAASGLLKTYVLAVFHSMMSDFLVEERGLTRAEAMDGSLFLSMMALMGIFVVAFSYHLHFDRIWPQIAMPIVFGAVLFLTTIVNNQRPYYILVAVAGFADGVQMGNSLAVANRLGGEKEMLFVLGVEQLTQGAGVFIWGFTIDSIRQKIGLKFGVYSAAIVSIASGLISALIPLHERLTASRKEAEKPKIVHSLFSHIKESEKQPLTKNKKDSKSKKWF